MTARYLAHKSAYTASRQARSTRLEDLIGSGLVASCAVVMLEILFSARSRRTYEEVRTELSEACEQIPMDSATR